MEDFNMKRVHGAFRRGANNGVGSGSGSRSGHGNGNGDRCAARFLSGNTLPDYPVPDGNGISK